MKDGLSDVAVFPDNTKYVQEYEYFHVRFAPPP